MKVLNPKDIPTLLWVSPWVHRQFQTQLICSLISIHTPILYIPKLHSLHWYNTPIMTKGGEEVDLEKKVSSWIKSLHIDKLNYFYCVDLCSCHLAKFCLHFKLSFEVFVILIFLFFCNTLLLSNPLNAW